MNKFALATLLTFCVASAQINVGEGDAPVGEENADTRIFGDLGNQFLLTTGAVVTGNIATSVLGGAFDAFRQNCRFRRRKRQTDYGKLEVDTRIICPSNL